MKVYVLGMDSTKGLWKVLIDGGVTTVDAYISSYELHTLGSVYVQTTSRLTEQQVKDVNALISEV